MSKAFPFIEWNAPIAVSKPEQALLKSAEANPLEYTIAEYGDAFAYARLLLKVLDQVTGPSNPGRVSELTLEGSSLLGQGLDEEEALEYLQDDKTGVVTHYLISQLYDMIGLLTERPARAPVQISNLFYQNDRLLDDWRPLLRLLYRPGDPYSQRGAALCLMYILKAGCRENESKKIPMVEETLQSLVSWLTSRLQSSHSASLGVITPTLVVLGSCPTARVIFDQAGGVGYLTRHLRPKLGTMTSRKYTAPTSPNSNRLRRLNGISSASASASASANPNGVNVFATVFSGTPSSPTTTTKKRSNSLSLSSSVSAQQLYELCFCLWTMSYEIHNNENIRLHFSRDGVVPALADLIAAAPREKVVRLSLSTLRRLAQQEPAMFIPEMIGCRVLKSVILLREQKQWTDQDIDDGTFNLPLMVCVDMCHPDLPSSRLEGFIHRFNRQPERFDQMGSLSSRVGNGALKMGHSAYRAILQRKRPPFGRASF